MSGDPKSMDHSHLADVTPQLASNIQIEAGSGDYVDQRQNLIQQERKRSWDHAAYSRAIPAEREAQDILVRIREHERTGQSLLGNLPSGAVPDRETRDMAGRFLRNKPQIERSTLFRIARRMPKGAHLHLHFNSCTHGRAANWDRET